MGPTARYAIGLGCQLTGATALSPVTALDEAAAGALLDICVAAVGADVILHGCAADLRWNMLPRSMIGAASVDPRTLRAADLDGIAAFVESGRTVMLGVVPARAPIGRAHKAADAFAQDPDAI